MSLTDTINNTNTQKENIKTVANNIDNKLVELGGEQATDLADVANKMGAMVTENYIKYAKMNIVKDFTETVSSSENRYVTLEIPCELSFIPKHISLELKACLKIFSENDNYTYCSNENHTPSAFAEDYEATHSIPFISKNGLRFEKNKILLSMYIYSNGSGYNGPIKIRIRNIQFIKFPEKE